MALIDSLLSGQLWIIVGFVALAVVMYAWVRQQRNVVAVHSGLFLFALVLVLCGQLVGSMGMTKTSTAICAVGLTLEGVVIIGLIGVLLFGGLLPICGLAFPRILQDVTVFVGQAVWVLFAMAAHGVDFTGVLTTSAVLTAVVGLAMQDTLGNIVSGLAVQLDKSLQVGDWVKLDDLSGRVVQTRWRYTAIETRNWETVLVPNSLLSKTRVLVLGRRTDAPVQWRRWVWFNLDFRFPPSQVIETVETAMRMAEIPRVAQTPAPNCVAMDFAESYTRYAVRYWLTDIAADDPTDSEVRVHIFSALQRAGMTLSIPAHAVFMTEETAQRKELKAQSSVTGRSAALRKVRLFSHLTDEHLEALAHRLVFAPFDRGDIMTRQGAQPHWLYLMIDGLAERFVENEDHESTKVADLGPGDIFGEWSLMMNTPRESTIIARSKVDCYRLPKEDFLEALKLHPEVSEEISNIIAQRRTALETALHHLDEEARKRRQSDNQSRVLEGLRRLFGI